MDHPDQLGLDPEGGRDQLGEGGLVALAVGDAGPGRDPAVGLDHDRAVLGPEPGHLDIGRQADAELDDLAALAPPGLLGPEGLVAGRLQDPVERALVVARVVAGLGGRGVGKGPGRDQVAPPHLGRVQAQPGRQQVDRPLDHGGGLGTAGAPVGGDRRGVGGHALPGHLDPAIRYTPDAM